MAVPSLKLNSGYELPVLGFGTSRLEEGDMAYRAVLAAIKSGYRHIDTAAMYGNEVSVGRAVRDSGVKRDEIFVTTKLHNNDHHDVMGAFAASLERLGLEYVDLYLIHWPMPQRLESWQSLVGIQASGRARSIGVSNFTQTHLAELLQNTSKVPAVNQIEFSPFLFQRQLLDYCHDQGIQLVAYSPLTRAHKLDDASVAAMAKRLGKSSAQVLLRWAIQHGVAVIPRSQNPVHITENAALFDWELTEKDMQQLDNLDENLRIMDDPHNFA